MTEPITDTPAQTSCILTLTVNNHPGVMSHICGLFARRAYNLEGILCVPVGDGRRSRIWLRVNEGDRLSQVCRHLEKLEDVIDVACGGDGAALIDAAAGYFTRGEWEVRSAE
jgi:acetolactate synthase-1/3 small subunit